MAEEPLFAITAAEDVEALDYRTLQRSCKAAKLSAKGTKVELQTRLLAHLQEQAAMVPSSILTPTSPVHILPAPTPLASTKPTNQTHQTDAAAFITAISSPLPGKGHALAATPATEVPMRQKKQQLSRFVSRLEAKAHALTPVRSATARTTHINWRVWFVSALVLAAGMGWQLGQSGRLNTARLPAAVRRSAATFQQHLQALHTQLAAESSQIRQQGRWLMDSGFAAVGKAAYRRVQHGSICVQQAAVYAWVEVTYHCLQVKQWGRRQWLALTTPAQKASACSARLAGMLLNGLVAKGDAWQNEVAGLQSLAPSDGDPPKATAVLLAGLSNQTDVAAARLHGKLAGRCQQHCVHQVKGSSYAWTTVDSRGELQKELGTFLRGCPQGSILFHELDKLHPDLLPVLVNVLSEQGQFEVDGQQLPTHDATFWFVANLPLDIYAHSLSLLLQSAVSSFSAAVKSRLTSRWSKYNEEGAVDAEHPQTLSARALRRRFDYVLPLAS